MKLTIDNLDGRGARDCTSAIDAAHAPRVLRRLNRPSELRLSLVATSPDFVVPNSGARLTLGRVNGGDVFTGYVTAVPEFEYLGFGECGPRYRYNIVAMSDEFLLDSKMVPNRYPFVARSAGDALRQLTEDLLPGVIDTSAVEDLSTLAAYSCDRRKRWSEHAAEIALLARGSYRLLGNRLVFAPIGATVRVLDESDNNLLPGSLRFQAADRQLNDILLVGHVEPQAYVKDYFIGDGLSLKFYLSQQPFVRSTQTLLEEEYTGTAIDKTRWLVNDTTAAIALGGGKLQVTGGTGGDGQTIVEFVEKVELGGALVLQHGDVAFNSPSDGVIGGLYTGDVLAPHCLAGFRITPAGGNSNIQALVNGAGTGPVVTTQPTHHYVLTTRLYGTQVYRSQQTFHSSLHPASNGRGGEDVPSSVRLVLDVHDIDPANPASIVTAATVLYEGAITSAPGFCTYALVDAANLFCTIAFTRMLRATDAVVRSALSGQGYRTRLLGPLSEGAECRVSTEPALQFFPQYVPAANEQIVVRYRGKGQAATRIVDPASIAALKQGLDDGTRGGVRQLKSPPPRTSSDCDNAALALLDDSTGPGWKGEYETWSDLLPGNTDDIFPGDAVRVNMPSRGATFAAIVREVDLTITDLRGEHARYKVCFADEAAEPLAFEFDAGRMAAPVDVDSTTVTAVATRFPASLPDAEVTQITSTNVTIDAGSTPVAGGGIEVRWSDYGWNQENDRNLVGRFTTQSFSVPRLGRTQGYFLRQYDGSSPARYSRYSTALHIDYPL